MKKAMVFLIVILAMLFLNFGKGQAQQSPIDKGSKLLDGGFTFTSVNYEYDDSKLFIVNPAMGLFVSKGFLLGGQFIYQSHSYGNQDYSLWGLGPELRYYFDTNGERQEIIHTLYPFLRTGFIYMKDDGDDTEFDWDLGAGLSYMLSNSVCAVVQFNYTRLNYKPDEWDSWISNSMINFEIGFSFFLY